MVPMAVVKTLDLTLVDSQPILVVHTSVYATNTQKIYLIRRTPDLAGMGRVLRAGTVLTI